MSGSEGASPFSYVDESRTDIFYSGGKVGIGDIAAGAADPAAQLILGKTVNTTEANLPTVCQTSVLFPGESNDLEFATHSSSGGVIISTGVETAPRVVVDSEGRLGVGTTAPTDRLHVGQGGAFRLDASGQVDPQDFRFSIGGPTPAYDTLYIQAESTPNSNMFNDLLAVRANGKLGLGTTDPQEKLDLSVDMSYGSVNSAGIRLGNANAPSVNIDAAHMYTVRTTGDQSGVRLEFITSSRANGGSVGSSTLTLRNGNVGVGTTTPVATLDVNGTARLARYPAQPFPCDADHDGTIALTSKYKICACNGMQWVPTDSSPSCNW